MRKKSILDWLIELCIRQSFALICRLMAAAVVDAVLFCGSLNGASIAGTTARKRGAS
jgi:hypothetical protein